MNQPELQLITWQRMTPVPLSTQRPRCMMLLVQTALLQRYNESTSVAANNMAEDDSCPSLHSETQMHDATHPNNISSLSTSVAANNVAEDDSCPSLHSETQMHDTTRPNNNSSLVARQLILDMLHDQLSTSIAANNVAEDDSCPSLHSETQMHDTTRPNNNSSLVYRHALLCLNVSCAHLQSSMC
ncbi:uncharacterized protein [Hoplias malabaricus]|uniref:uncharacterized protein isoform X6 n=1 Tax=Hoplias malabaricus TaxID=27720 RepID=UPI0034625922